MTGRTGSPYLFSPEGTSPAIVQELGWWMPLFLFLAGWVTYLFRTNTGFIIGTAIGTVIVCRSIYLLVSKCQDLRFSWITGCGLLLGYALGSLNTALQLAKSHQTIAEHFSRLQDDLSIALSLVFWISATLFLVGFLLERPIRLNRTKLLDTDVIYVYIGVLIYLGALATGQIGYMGAAVSDDRHVTVVGTLAAIIGPTLPAITVLLRNKSKLLRRTLPFRLLLLVEIACLLPSGRRAIIYSLFCVVFAFTLVGDRWRSPIWKKILVVSTCLAGLYCVNMLYYAMRYSAEQSGAAKRMGAPDMPLSELVASAVKFIKDGRNSSFDEDMAANLQDRTFVLPYLSDLIAQSRTRPGLHGQIVLFGLGMATPTAIYSLYGDKDKVLALGMEEMVANPHFGLPAKDEANSLLTGGISDFGILGAFVYPIVLALLMNFGVRVVLGRAPELIKFLGLLMCLWMLFQTEMAVTGVIVGTRNLAIVMLGWIPIAAVTRFFMKASNRVPDRLHGKCPATVTLVRYEYEVVPKSR
jgi:hypothetical protein